MEALSVNGVELKVVVKPHWRARHLRVRLDRHKTKVILTVPTEFCKVKASGFLEEARDWVASRLCLKSNHIYFMEGAKLPLLGQNYTLRHLERSRFSAWLEGQEIYIRGPQAKMSENTQRFLRNYIKNYLEERSFYHAERLGVKVGKITIREMRSRWGSCSYKGDLSYFWRLIFVPEFVADYICAHEVAHIKEHNHSPKFWQHVAHLCPRYQEAKAWLKEHGHSVFYYG